MRSTLARSLLSVAIPIASCAVLAAGCASGGGDTRGNRDAGRRRDAAPLPTIDGGPIVGEDAAGPERDSGPIVPPPMDSGPGPDDAGPPPDAGGPGDAGMGVRDAGRDTGPPPECTSAPDCDDGVVCNGVERCEFGSCVAGTPPVCDDGVACTRDRCVEPASGTTPSCEYAPDDSLCGAGQVCGATGCTSACSESPCRLVAPQCGCPAGQGCYLAGATRSCSAAGTAAEGASCAAANGCQPGLACLNISQTATPVSQCMRFCGTDADCVGAGSLCIYTLDDGAGGSVPGVRVCSRSCNPMTSAGCSASAACRVYRESTGAMRFLTDCSAPYGPGGQYSPCVDDADCQRGYGCFPSPFGGNECLQWCRVGGLDCSFGETCYSFTPPIVIGGVQYGVCDF